MALTALQRRICRLLAADRIASGESYVARGVALNELIGAARVSRDVDVFRDSDAALEASWGGDRTMLETNGLSVRVLRERIGLVEAEVSDATDRARLEWARDSAYRFFPLQEHEEFGLTLHPLDLAANKVLALVGRLEVRDWVDVIASDERIQPLGYLAWAAAGKDPGWGPRAIIEAAARTGRYSVEEFAALDFEGEAPDPGALGRAWHRLIDVARETVALLPPGEAGSCVLSLDGDLIRHDPAGLGAALEDGHVRFHRGSIRGVLPSISG
jgi:hypothetical protein